MKRLFTLGAFSVLCILALQSSARPMLGQTPTATLSPSSLDFGNQVAKTPSKPLRITVTNNGNKKLYIKSVVVGGDAWSDFGLTGDTCTGESIAPQKSCVVDVIFTPSRTGSRTSILTFTDDAIDSPQNAKLSGTGINSVDVPPGE